jgi:hypothetical protein
MTSISLGQAARLSPPDRMAIAATKLGRVSTRNSRHLVRPAQLRQQFQMHVGDVTPWPQEFAGNFVDFLLGRGARHPR